MFKISLPKVYFTTGEPISGELVFSPNKAKKIKYVIIIFRGYEHTEWRETRSVQHATEDRVSVEQKLSHQRKRRPLIYHMIVVFPPHATNRTSEKSLANLRASELAAGSYVWPFTFNIPENLPSSISYREGKVRILYKLKGVVDPKWSSKIESKQILKIGLLYAVNAAIQPKSVEGKKSFLLAKSDNPVVARVTLNKEVTYSGDEIIVYVDVDNQSSKSIQSIVLKIKQFISFGSRKEVRTILKREHKQGLPISERWKYQDSIRLQIPQLELMPTVTNAGLITVKYWVDVHFGARAAKKLIVKAPFIVASFPPIILNPNNAPSAPMSPHQVNQTIPQYSSSVIQPSPYSPNSARQSISQPSVYYNNNYYIYQQQPQAPPYSPTQVNRSVATSPQLSHSFNTTQSQSTFTPPAYAEYPQLPPGYIPPLTTPSEKKEQPPIIQRDQTINHLERYYLEIASSLENLEKPPKTLPSYTEQNKQVAMKSPEPLVAATMQPVRDIITPLVVTSASNAIVEVSNPVFETENSLEQITLCVRDLDSASLYAQMGELDEVADVGEQCTHDTCQLELTNATKELSCTIETCVAAIKRNSLTDQQVKQISTAVQEVSYHTKRTATLIGDKRLQFSLLAATKAVAISCQQLLLASKLLNSNIEDTHGKELMSTSVSGIFEGINNLLKVTAISTSENQAKLELVNQTKKNFQNALLALMNPFSDMNATWDEVNEIGKEISTHVSTLLIACNASHEQTMMTIKALGSLTCSLMPLLRGATIVATGSQSDIFMNQTLFKYCQELSNAIFNLIETAANRPGKSGSDMLVAQEKLSGASFFVASKLNEVFYELMNLKSSPNTNNTPNLFEPNHEDGEVSIKELKDTVAELEVRATELQQQHEETEKKRRMSLAESDYTAFRSQQTNEEVLLASKSVACATQELLQLVLATEQERSEKNDLTARVYSIFSQDATVKAAKKLSAATVSLIEHTKENSSQDVISESSKEVAAAVANLVSTSSNMTSPDIMKKLSESARSVALATSHLISIAQAAEDRKQDLLTEYQLNQTATEDYESDEEEQPQNQLPLHSSTGVQKKVRHYEQQLKIIQLERALEKAREEFSDMKRQDYFQ